MSTTRGSPLESSADAKGELTVGAQKNSLWYKDAVIYQLHVRSFCDSNADGIGDFVGLTQKLDYLQELGITAIWLLPFYPSPLRDDGYDVADYTSVHASYGSLEDFKAFLAAAHDRGIRIIIDAQKLSEERAENCPRLFDRYGPRPELHHHHWLRDEPPLCR